jgi:hypothetical protein
MEKIFKKSLNTPDETRTFDKGKVELVTIGKVTFGRAVFQPGWKWSECVKPIVKTESCMAGHTQYVISGKLHIAMDDGTEFDVSAGDASVLPPGHDGWVVGDEPCVVIDVTGMTRYAKPSEATKK